MPRANPKTLIVIPARIGSTRLPEKMLLNKTGKPLICHTYERALSAKADKVIVATDEPRIVAAINNFGGIAQLTKSTHQSGTDRVAEIASSNPEFDIIINVQGDEPEVDPEAINKLIELQKEHAPFIGTMCCPFSSSTNPVDSPQNPACVKVALGKAANENSSARFALYFSRSLIPYPQATKGTVTNPQNYYRHLGIYAFSKESLKKFTALPNSFLATTESLEQLRALENGHQILVGEVAKAFSGIDTIEDYEQFVKRQNHAN